MKPLLLTLLLIPFACLGQNCSDEDFLTDVIQSWYSSIAPDSSSAPIIADIHFDTPHQTLESADLTRFSLPDSSLQQLIKYQFSNNKCCWDTSKIKVEQSHIFFFCNKDINLLLGKIPVADPANSKWYKDSISRIDSIMDSMRNKYHVSDNTYLHLFCRPLFDKYCRYALLGRKMFCDIGTGRCGSGEIDLYRKKNNKWEFIAVVSHWDY